MVASNIPNLLVHHQFPYKNMSIWGFFGGLLIICQKVHCTGIDGVYLISTRPLDPQPPAPQPAVPASPGLSPRSAAAAAATPEHAAPKHAPGQTFFMDANTNQYMGSFHE